MSIKSSTDRAKVQWGRAFFLVLLGVQLAACATPEVSRTQTSREPVTPKPDQEMARLQEAVDHFKSADYQKALALFEEVSRTAQSEPVRRKALYAQGCTRLITAQSAEEYSSALALWQSWSRLAPLGGDEDPRMLSPFWNGSARHHFPIRRGPHRPRRRNPGRNLDRSTSTRILRLIEA